MIAPETIKDRFGKIERPYPWERKMTVCIAAMSDEADIVLCSDTKMSSSLGSTETQRKQLYLSPRLLCLTAGYESDIKALYKIMRQKVDAESRLDETNFSAVIRNALKERKQQKASELIAGNFGMDYEEFIKTGKERFPADVFREMFIKIAEIDLGTEFVIAGYLDDGSAVIAETGGKANVAIKENFGVAGEARYLATAVLLQREIGQYSGLSEVLYATYEAKRYAEKISSVGSYTTISVMSIADDRISMGYVSESGMDFLRNLYIQYGPKKFEGVKLPERGQLYWV